MTARILIVDDVPANTRLLEARLAAEYYESAVAHDGATAITMAREWQPDIMLLDVMMPGIDGFETCRRLKSDPATAHIPVVMITTLEDSAARITGLEVGADDFLSKPVDFPTLFARVKSLVRLKRLLDEWRKRSETARALGLAAATLAPPIVSGASALVVDDTDEGASAIAAALAQDGIVTEGALGETMALAAVAATPFDLIVLSLGLHGEDPLRLASRLRASEARRTSRCCWWPTPRIATGCCAALTWAPMTGCCARSTPTNCAPARATRSAARSTRTACGWTWDRRWKRP